MLMRLLNPTLVNVLRIPQCLKTFARDFTSRFLHIRRLKHCVLFSLLLTAQTSFAALTAMTEDELSDTTGQAFVKIENFNASEHADYDANLDKDYSFTRVQFGVDMKMLLNIDKMELGKYERFDDPVGAKKDSDVLFYNFALGHIDQDDNIVPFEMKDPFLEFAYDESEGKKDLVGFRLGFGQSRGIYSVDIQHMTGNIDVKIRDNEMAIELGGIPLTLPGNVNGVAQLIAGGEYEGVPDDIRADTIGIAKGDALLFYPEWGGIGGFIGKLLQGILGIKKGDPIPLMAGGPGGDACHFTAMNASGNGGIGLPIESCFKLSKYRSVPVGVKVGDDPKEHKFTYAPGLFVSFQTQGDIKWGAPDEQRRDTVKGVFFNVPTGSVEITFEEANEGLPRSRTEFISRGIAIDDVVITDPEGNPITNPRWGTDSIYEPI